MIRNKSFLFFLLIVALFALGTSQSGCGCGGVHYGFREGGSVPDSLKTIRIAFVENRAPYVNPQLSPTLTEKLRRKFVNQTKLRQINDEGADIDLKAEVRDYAVTTSGVSNKTEATNRLTVVVHIIITKAGKTEEHDISRPYDFDARLSLQAAETELIDRITRDLSDDIFNRLFSNW